MVSFKKILATAATLFSLASSQQFYIQNWGNGEKATNYTYKSLEGGRFTLDWILGAGGNFVSGKGYRGNKNLYVAYTSIYDTRTHTFVLTHIQRSQLHRQLQSPRKLLPCPLRLY
jgi:endo-1,4-beta-xylanase